MIIEQTLLFLKCIFTAEKNIKLIHLHNIHLNSSNCGNGSRESLLRFLLVC